MDTRKCLFYAASGMDEVLLQSLRQHGWMVSLARDAEEAQSLKIQSDICVGLVSIGENALADWVAIQNVISFAGVTWVALVNPGLTVSRELLQLLAKGFHDYHVLPADADRVLFSLYQAAVNRTGGFLPAGQPMFPKEAGLAGSSPGSLQFQAAIDRASQSDQPVLIQGDAGTGKEAVARAIHRRSWRGMAPFISVTCAEVPGDQLRLELFGLGDGGYPGDQALRRGRVDAAQVGVLFLDGVEALSADAQDDLLQLLQTRVFRRVGAEHPIPVDLRVMASTQVDLKDMVAEGRFSEALLAALSGHTVTVPALSERRDDIEWLARYFLKQQWPDVSCSYAEFAPETLETMRRHDWPGNIRELVNRIGRAATLSEGQPITPQHLGLVQPRRSAGSMVSDGMTLGSAKSQAEKEVIEAALEAYDHNISRAARQLGVSRMTLYRLMDKHQVRGAVSRQC
jgi:DNA-binding NtrC family response regulator